MKLLSRLSGVVFTVAALALSSSVYAQGTTSNWEVTLESPQGAMPMTLALTVDGEKASGSLNSPMGAMPVSGTLAGGTLTLTGNMEVQGMSLALGVSGKIEGDTLSAAMKVGDFGEFPLNGKRAGAAAAPAAPAPAASAPAAGATSAAGQGVAGKWNVILSVAGMGDVPVTADLKQDGPNVTGTISSMMGDVAVKGTLTGTALKLEFTAETPQGPLTVTMSGELGATGLVGKASLAGLGEADWKATRQ